MIQKGAIYLCLICFTLVWSQEGKVQHKVFTKQDGLELDYIDTMVYDDDGFIWLGGSSLDMREIINSDKQLSLQRFNGKTFHNIPLPTLEKPIQGVGQLLNRPDGQMYVLGTLDGDSHFLLLFNPITTAFKRIPIVDDTNKKVYLSRIFNYLDTDYILYQIGQTITLAVLTEDTTLQTVFSYTDTEHRYLLDDYTVFLPFKDFVIIGDNHLPLHYFSWDGTLLKRDSVASKIDRDNGENVRRYVDEYAQQKGITYLMLYKNPVLHYVNEEAKTIVPVEASQVKLESDNLKVAKDAFGNSIWVSTREGIISLNEIDKNKEVKARYQKELFDTSQPFSILTHDVSKELWMGRNRGELHYFRFPSKTVRTFLPNYGMRAIVALDENRYIAATERDGWFEVNLLENTITPFSITLDGIEIAPNSSRAIYKEGNVLWSNDGGSILKVDITTHEATRYRHYPVIAMKSAADSTFVYGTNGYALMEFNKQTKAHIKLLDTNDYFIYGLASYHNLWVCATDKGVVTYNTETKQHKMYGKDFLEDPYLLMATHHPDYGFLLGSRSGIIYQFNPGDETFTILYKDALQAGIATLLFEEDTWWINTFNGIVAFDPMDDSLTRYSEKDGFSHNEANRYSALDTGDGFLVGTIEGLNYFNPKELKNETPKWNLTLLATQYYDTETASLITLKNRKVLNELSKIVLPQENKTLSLDFALTNNTGGMEHSFRYRLNEEDWVDLKDQQSISFPNLAAGNYVLEIAALDFSGNSIGAPLLYTIHSKDFFYNQWWFYLIVLLSSFGIALYLLNQSKIKQKLQEQFSGALLISQEQERTRIAKELHDSIGQQLTLIKRKAQHEEKEEIAALSHKTLEEVRSISRGLYPAFLKQLGLSESIEQLVLEIDEDTSLFCTAEIDDIDPYFSEDAKLNFYRFIQESVNNSLKHAEATNLSVVVKDMPKNIVLQIKDNGKGFDVSEAIKNNSLGLKTLKERMRLLKGSLYIQSSSAKGTFINCEIPKK